MLEGNGKLGGNWQERMINGGGALHDLMLHSNACDVYSF